MSGWREQILQQFQPQVARLTLVADPDRLLMEEGILEGIRVRGFDLISFADPVAFRYAYEAQYRQRWDRGETTELMVALHAEEDDLRDLSYDLLQNGRRLPVFRLASIFPKLSNPIVQAVDRALLDRLYDAYQEHDGGELGDRGTKSFILRRVFHCDAEQATTTAGLVRLLIEKHTGRDRWPAVLEDYLIEVLKRRTTFAQWPVEHLVRSRTALLEMLQAQWPQFLERFAQRPEHAVVGERRPVLDAAGSLSVPFDELKPFVDTLFLDGDLKPVRFDPDERVPAWAHVGIVRDPSSDMRRRFESLLEKLDASLPDENAPYSAWQQFAWRWAEAQVLRHELGSALGALETRLTITQGRLDDAFEKWMCRRFATLVNLVEIDGRPIVVHHIVSYLDRRRRLASEKRTALVVVDGMGLDQWLIIRDDLRRGFDDVELEEIAIFAWIPTVTPISRQAIFAGEMPFYFATSLQSTGRDGQHWQRVWEGYGVSRARVDFRRNVAEAGGASIDDLIDDQDLQVLGLVVNTVDNLVHGRVLGTADLHNGVRLWAERGDFQRLVRRLLDGGFVVYVAADHGNVEAVGIGRPQEGALVESGGERARMYDGPDLRRRAVANDVRGLEWPGPGLPTNACALLATQRDAFVRSGLKVVAHGGIALEEVLVPFVRIARRS